MINLDLIVHLLTIGNAYGFSYRSNVSINGTPGMSRSIDILCFNGSTDNLLILTFCGAFCCSVQEPDHSHHTHTLGDHLSIVLEGLRYTYRAHHSIQKQVPTTGLMSPAGHVMGTSTTNQMHVFRTTAGQ